MQAARKFCIIVPDGMADWPLAKLSGRTPMEVARKPNMDRVAAEGVVGMARLVPGKMQPSSDVANLCLLGYDPRKYHTGRGPLEAASLGIKLGPREIAFRLNLITVDGKGVIEDYCAGEIPSKEAAVIVDAVKAAFADKPVRFHPGISFKHIMVYFGDAEMAPTCFAPHDHMGEDFHLYLPKGPGSELLIEMILASRKLLENHEINKVRIDLGENPANMIWPWSPGRTPDLEQFESRWGIKGAVICCVDLIKGIAALAGLDRIDVPGATGSYDTDYAAKGRYAINALRQYDFVFVHVEAPDTAGHAGDVQQKIKAIEEIDRHVVGPVHEALKSHGNYRLLVMPDHPTVIEKRTHVSEPVPFALCGAGIGKDRGKSEREEEGGEEAPLPFAESSVPKTALQFDEGHRLIEYMIKDGADEREG